jgi:RNA polymerase sigma factor (sigma-70 family)
MNELLRDYVERQSEKAFTELVALHVNLVYGTALRIVREPQLAQDVAQSVFIQLARKARSVRDGNALPGWLYRVTCSISKDFIRGEHRRRERETEAMNRIATNSADEGAWQTLAPFLDEAVQQLNRVDQSAVVLRFMEGKSLREVGQCLAMTDDAVQKRVSRALEKLRNHFSRRGITATSPLIMAAFSASSLQSAPLGLAATLAKTSLANAAVTGLPSLAKVIIMTKTKTTILVAVITAAVAIPVVLERQKNARLRQEIVALQWEKAALVSQQSVASPDQDAPASTQAIPAVETTKELLPSVAEIVRKMAALMAGSKPTDAASQSAFALKFAGLVAQIAPDQLDAALLAASKLPKSDERTAVIGTLFHRWSEINPRAALAFATVEFQGVELAAAVNEAVQSWSGQDPDAAFAAWREQTSDPSKRPAWGGDQQGIAKSIFQGLSEKDFQKAADYLKSVDRDYFGSALAGLGKAAARTEQGRTFFLGQLEQVSDPVIYNSAAEGFMSQWVVADFASAKSWVEDQPAENRGAFLRSVGVEYIRQNPSAAADWWLAQAATAKDRSDGLFTIAQTWARSDVDAAGAWLSRQGTGPETDGARMAYAESAVYHDPEVGMKWAQSISQTTLRDQTLVSTWQRWQRLDPAAANRFLDQAGWTKELAAQARGL